MTDSNPVSDWATTLQRLKTTQSKNLYDQRLACTRLVEAHNGTYVIDAGSELNRDWLQNRLNPILQRNVSAIAGRPITLKFVVDNQARQQEPEPTEAPQPQFSPPAKSPLGARGELEGGKGGSQPSTEGLDFRPLRDKSYIPVATYGIKYWQPWLDQQSHRSYKLWLSLQIGDTRNTFEKGFEDWWTPPAYYRIRELSATVGAKGNTPTLTGRLLDCATCARALEDGEPLAECCKAFSPIVWRQLNLVSDDQRMCQHWGYGSFQCLQDAHLLAVEVSDGNTHSHQMQLQIWRQLPILTPAQVADLPDVLQVEHDQWLTNHGERLLGLGLQDWQRIEADNLVPTLPGYYENRSLGTYQWNRIIREGLQNATI